MPTPNDSAPRLSIEQFEDRLAEGDRWIELVAGRLIRLDPPDEMHGDVVRNLSRPLAAFLKLHSDVSACFELPLILSRQPATVRTPAICCFQSSQRFAESDKLLTDSQPLLIIEVASTNDRREGMSERVRGYLEMGTRGVWVVDPVTRHVHVFHPPSHGIMLKETQFLRGAPILPEFQVLVSDLFQQPKWDRREAP